MLAAPERWMPSLVRDTEREREALLSEVGIRDDGGRSRRPAEVTFGEALRLPAKTILPMRWQPSSAWPLFPQLDADLEVASLGPSRTQLSVNARYTPPLGRLGSVIGSSPPAPGGGGDREGPRRPGRRRAGARRGRRTAAASGSPAS